MSQAYGPSRNATAGDPWDTAFLSERDVSSQVPINYVPHAGIYLTPACFPDGVYEDDAAQLCISNLIASQLRRFIIDIYWDPVSRVFGLCPVRAPNAPATSTSTSTSSQTAPRSITSANLDSVQDLRARQTSSPTNTNSTDSATGATTTTTTAPVTSSTSESGTILYHLGRYQCSTSLDIDKVLDVFQSYYEQSANTIDARLQYLVFNLHATRLYSSPDQEPVALSGGELPSKSENLESHLDNLNEYLYIPSQLSEERLNLNATWYRQSSADLLPLSKYFTTQSLPNGDIASPNGWPNEGYVQFIQSRRVLLTYGTVAGEMQEYDVRQDSSVFAPGSLGVDRMVTLNDTGSVIDGCFYNASDFSVAQINSSWAVASVMITDLNTLGNGADNLTTCGISPLLNATLAGTSAANSPIPYQSLGNQALFSWAVDQPTDQSDYGNSIDGPLYRCAVIVSNSDYRGHWRVADCQSKNYVACRIADGPYEWQISNDKYAYASAPSACDGNTSFGVPRTGLENNYLHQRILQEATQRSQSDILEATWINFNSLDVEDCWVTTGPNGTCSYRPDTQAIRQRQILVPAIAAFIVLLLTVLTILVKCNANRRNSKIRKRGEDGWDYEGVPS